MTKPAPQLETEPLIVSLKTGRIMLGNCSNNKMWQHINSGQLELVGTPRKWWVTVASIRALVANMPRRVPGERRPANLEAGAAK
jgi:hypothetical protein